MRQSIIVIVALCGAAAPAALAGSAFTGSGWAASTDRVAYSGTVTRFATQADAVANVAPTSGPFTMPDRAAATPFNTPSRDLGLLMTDNFTPFGDANPNDDFSESNIFLTAWYYTNVAGEDRYSGQGNPSNDNQGFVQLYDQDGSTTVTRDASFGDFDGTNWTTFSMTASGVNADFDNDSSRLWNAPGPNDFPDVTFGLYSQWSFSATFGGLEGTETAPGVVEAFDHPDSVTGSFTGIFFNNNTINPAFNGWYRVDLELNMDSWAFGQGASLVGGPIDDSYFAVVPAPGTFATMMALGLTAARRRRVR